jgi:hypothetical protein
MRYFPIPVLLLEIGKPLPVDLWSASGNLLLRKGQPVLSEEHREKLQAHDASATLADALAWQRAYERLVHKQLQGGMDAQEIGRIPMPSELSESDFVVVHPFSGGWLDLQEVLRGILYQGGLAINPLMRLAGIEKKAMDLLRTEPDDSLFCLFQALADDTLGYCATHALLCAVVCELTAEKIGMPSLHRKSLVNAALTMNIGMARDQDSLARQSTAPSAWQRSLIEDHPQKGIDILRGFGIADEDQLDAVQWHHSRTLEGGLPYRQAIRQLLVMADMFVAKMAARKTRSPLSPVGAVKSLVMGAQGDALGVSSAMAQAVGFYPPGSYVLLVNGETAVSVRHGARANTPWVISIIDKNGMPITLYQCRDTSNPSYAISTPLNFEKVRVAVNLEKVRRARALIGR